MSSREQILQAACELISVQGYSNTSLDEILCRSGIKKGSFYFHFHSKEELGFAIVERIEEMFDQYLRPIFDEDHGDPILRVFRFLEETVESQKAKSCCGGCPFGNLAIELGDSHEGFRQRVHKIFLMVTERIQKALEASAENLKPGTDCRALAQFIFSSLEGAIMMVKVTKDAGDLERCIEQLRQHILGRLKNEVAAGYETVAG
ncbi:MAG: TetR/AcrR family transcriptional regulator [Acidobacteriota bacterium]